MRRASLALTLLLACSQLASANPLAGLSPVGQATLRVLFFNIYTSSLYNADGNYSGIEPGLALEINYRRRISSEQLIDRTREEWQKQDLYRDRCETWLGELAAMWPDVRRGDVIVLKVGTDLASDFYFNDELIGRMEDPEFTRNFLAIWLSTDSSYPRLREQLLGLSGG